MSKILKLLVLVFTLSPLSYNLHSEGVKAPLTKEEKAQQKANEKIVKDYIKQVKKNNFSDGIPIGKFDVKIIDKYWKDVKKLKVARDKFLKADDACSENPSKSNKAKREKALLKSSIMTIEYMLKDYKKQNKVFPIEWLKDDLK